MDNIKHILLVAILFFLLSCREKQPVPVTDEVRLDTIPQKIPVVNLNIIPGQSIGNVSLEQNASELAFLGTADLSDAAMGKAWETWYSSKSNKVSGKTELNIYTTYKDREMNEKVVRQIRITSPDFKTPEGLSVGSSFEEIHKTFAHLEMQGSFIKPNTTNTIKLYDAVDSGIAFEIENTDPQTCTAIIVHRKHVKATEEYLNFHPDLVKP